MKSKPLPWVAALSAVALLATACGSSTGTEIAGTDTVADSPTSTSSIVVPSTLVVSPAADAGPTSTGLGTRRQGDHEVAAASDQTTSNDASSSVAPTTNAPVTNAPTTNAPSVSEAPAAAEPAVTSSTVSPAVGESADAAAVPVAADGPRNLSEQSWTVFATFADVTLVHPSNRVERVGFHESNNDGARQLEPAVGAVNPLTLESRDRDTGSRTAVDIVVEPGTEIRAPVTGTVLRAGGYVLYCEHQDDFVVIEPDTHPGWEVKILHISGVQVTKGQRVEAGVTVLAPAATLLPFDSQVDEFTAEPSWPHVHIELVDPSIPDRPSSGGGC